MNAPTKSPPERPTFADQAALELEQARLGSERFMAAVAKARGSGEEARLPPHRRLIESWLDPLAAAIRHYVDESKRRPGPESVAVKLLAEIEPDAAALVVLLAILNHASRVKTQAQGLAIAIGADIEEAIRIEALRRDQPALFAAQTKHHDRAGASQRQRGKAMKAVAASHTQDMALDRTERLHVGMQCLRLAINACAGAFRFEQITLRDNERPLQFIIDANVTAWLDEALRRSADNAVVPLPTIIPPKDWTGPEGGGYHTDLIRPLPIIRSASGGRPFAPGELRRLDFAKVLPALNVLQSTPWRINRFVLETAKALRERGRRVKVLLTAESLEPEPPKPADIDVNEAARAAWRKAAAQVKNANARQIGRVVSTRRLLDIADRFAAFPAFWFPHTCDARGRVYPVPTLMHPQAGGLSWGVMEFAEGKPLGGEEAARWLIVALANAHGRGVNKRPFQGRVDWVAENADMIRSVTADPLGDERWHEAEEPWQFLALAHEVVGYWREGFAFVSHMPVTMDGTCNALQHLAALTRDADVGREVNMLPGDAPRDLYQVVADGVAERLTAERDAAFNEPNASLSRDILSIAGGRIDRSAVKSSVMVMAYGLTDSGMRDKIYDWLDDADEAGLIVDDRERRKAAVMLFGRHLKAAMAERIKGPMMVLDWLCDLAGSTSDGGGTKPIRFMSPAGFPVVVDYRETKVKPVKAGVCKFDRRNGKGHDLDVREFMPKINMRSQKTKLASAVGASLDAACLMETALRLEAAGVTAFNHIHDCYGTHAADMTKLAPLLRDVFASLYEREDVLSRIGAEIVAAAPATRTAKPPPPPERGALDIGQVRKADYFFS